MHCPLNQIPGKLDRSVQCNTITSSEQWETTRAACESDPGAYHGHCAKTTTYWYNPSHQAWVMYSETLGRWSGWDLQCHPINFTAHGWEPWYQALDESRSPCVKWFCGAQTNAAFNCADRHVLEGHGSETALICEGVGWDSSAECGCGTHTTATVNATLMLVVTPTLGWELLVSK